MVTPVRTCIGCRKKDEPSGLLRMTVSADEGAERIVVPDRGRRAPGRGAHLHPTTECLDLAERRKAFPRAFRVPGPLSLRLVREYVNSECEQRERVVSPGEGARTGKRVIDS